MVSSCFRRGPVFCPNRRLSSFSPRGRPFRRPVLLRPRPDQPGECLGRHWPSLGSSRGPVNPPGAGDGLALGASAGLLAPASRGTATPTGYAVPASGPSGRPRAGECPGAWTWEAAGICAQGSARPSGPCVSRERQSFCF